VDGVRLEPLQSGREPLPLRRTNQERTAPLAALQQAAIHEPRQPGPNGDPRYPQGVHQLGLGGYTVPRLVETPQQKILYPTLDLQIEGRIFPRIRI
jgi:hypothetical protein